MANKRELIKRDTNNKVIEKIREVKDLERKNVSDALSTLYVAGLGSRLIVELINDLLGEIKSDTRPQKD